MATEATMLRPSCQEQAAKRHAFDRSGGRRPLIALLRLAVFGNDEVRHRMASFLEDTSKSALLKTCKRISHYSMEGKLAPPSSAAGNVLEHDDTCVVFLCFLDAKSMLRFGATCVRNRKLASEQSLWKNLYASLWSEDDTIYYGDDGEDSITCWLDHFRRRYCRQKSYRDARFWRMFDPSTNDGRYEDLTGPRRGAIVEFTLELAHRVCQNPVEVACRAVQIFDRYCHRSYLSADLGLCGLTAFMIAVNLECSPPLCSSSWCAEACNPPYRQEEIGEMEASILRKLHWKTSLVPTSWCFLDHYLTISKASPVVRHLATYYVQVALLRQSILFYHPSSVCVSCIIVAMTKIRMLEEGDECYKHPGLPGELLLYTNLSRVRGDLISIAKAAFKDFASLPGHQRHLSHLQEVYAQEKYMCVSTQVGLPCVQFSYVDAFVFNETRKYFRM